MVKVPSLSGLTRTTATQSITDSGLIAVETGSITTANDTLNQKIASQTPALDTLVDYETNVSYTYYLFSFTPYSFTPTPVYSFTPVPYSFTPQTYSFTPTPSGPSYIMPNVIGMTESAAALAIIAVGINYEFTNLVNNANGATALNTGKVKAQSPAPGTYAPELANNGSGATLDIYNYVAVYSFTPYSFTPTAASGVWYTHCSNPASGGDGSVVGPFFWANATCAQVLQTLTQTGELGPGNNFNCAVGPEAGPSPIAAANCTPPYSFTPYSFTPYAFTPVYSFTPTAVSGVWYAYCASSGAGGGSEGPFFWANKTCAQVQQTLIQTGEFGSNFNCAVGTEGGTPSVSAPSCGAPYSFTPAYSFTPVAYSFTPYSFTPVYSFTPYSFTPVYSFVPYSFTPTAYSFVPLKVCIDQDTLIQVVGLENSVEFKAAKDIKLEDQIWSITWEGLLDDLQDPSASTVYPENLQGVQRVKSKIVQIEPSIKETTIYFNGDKNKRFTAEEKVLIKRGSSHIFVEAKTITTSDLIFEATDSGMVATPVTGIDYIEETRNVFKFNAFPVDTIIAGNMVVHNSKV